MNRAIRYLLIFIILSVCFYFLFIGFFGKNGYLYNNSLERMIIQLELMIERKSYDISSLSKYSNYLKSEDGMRDLAMKMGYYVAGDHYYISPDGQLQNAVEIPVSDSEVRPFKYISNINCFLISLGSSLLVTLTTLLLDFKKHSSNSEVVTKEESFTGLDNFIQ